jgi:hypothetical protein
MSTENNKLALDRASVRTYDGDGRLHVSKTPISKANVCPYLGREIPGSEQLGLAPEKVYQLLRDPEELRKAAPTANNLQLLYQHKPVSAANPSKELTVGSTGTDAVFESPYLYNSLVVWDKDAIEGIETNEQKELSAGYYYRADMTPGTYEGAPYDGVMRDIRFNHVALVVDGRAGSDVVVGDSMENLTMSKKQYLSRVAAMAKGVLHATLTPRLAQDAKINLDPLLLGVTASNWKASKQSIVAALKSEKNTPHFKDKMAQDAAVEDVIELLNSMEGEQLGDKPVVNQPKDDDMSKDASKEAIMALISAQLSPEDAAKVEHLLEMLGEDDLDVTDPEGDEVAILEKLLAKLRGGGAEDEDDIGKGAPLNIPAKPAVAAQKTPAAGTAVDRAAMDAAIKAAELRAVNRMNAIEEAKRIVKPFVGNVIGMDSAEAVYRLALDEAGVELDGVHPSAYKAMVGMLPKPGEEPAAFIGKKLGMDGKEAAASASKFAELFPTAGNVRHL